ncbi:MAG: hypothetical protein ACFB4J_08560 [Elainellaceae cyanobacterium]
MGQVIQAKLQDHPLLQPVLHPKTTLEAAPRTMSRVYWPAAWNRFMAATLDGPPAVQRRETIDERPEAIADRPATPVDLPPPQQPPLHPDVQAREEPQTTIEETPLPQRLGAIIPSQVSNDEVTFGAANPPTPPPAATNAADAGQPASLLPKAAPDSSPDNSLKSSTEAPPLPSDLPTIARQPQQAPPQPESHSDIGAEPDSEAPSSDAALPSSLPPIRARQSDAARTDASEGYGSDDAGSSDATEPEALGATRSEDSVAMEPRSPLAPPSLQPSLAALPDPLQADSNDNLPSSRQPTETHGPPAQESQLQPSPSQDSQLQTPQPQTSPPLSPAPSRTESPQSPTTTAPEPPALSPQATLPDAAALPTVPAIAGQAATPIEVDPSHSLDLEPRAVGSFVAGDAEMTPFPAVPPELPRGDRQPAIQPKYTLPNSVELGSALEIEGEATEMRRSQIDNPVAETPRTNYSIDNTQLSGDTGVSDFSLYTATPAVQPSGADIPPMELPTLTPQKPATISPQLLPGAPFATEDQIKDQVVEEQVIEAAPVSLPPDATLPGVVPAIQTAPSPPRSPHEPGPLEPGPLEANLAESQAQLHELPLDASNAIDISPAARHNYQRSRPPLPAAATVPTDDSQIPPSAEAALLQARFTPLMDPLRRPLGQWRSLQERSRVLPAQRDPQQLVVEQLPIAERLADNSVEQLENQPPETWYSLEELLAEQASPDPWEEQFALPTPQQTPRPKLADDAGEGEGELGEAAPMTPTLPSAGEALEQIPAQAGVLQSLAKTADALLDSLVQKPAKLDDNNLELLAQAVYLQVRDRLVLAQERHGLPLFYPLPWLAAYSQQSFMGRSPPRSLSASSDKIPTSREVDALIEAVSQNLASRLCRDRERHGY